jgi:nucleoside-diphosphate kinase
MIEQTLIIFKPDAVSRQLVGTIISRFEHIGLTFVGLKLVQTSKETAGLHYQELAEKYGQQIYQSNVDFLCSGPIIVGVIQGVHAVEVVRKLVGATDPSKSQPGTIRGDFCHASIAYSVSKQQALQNILHASSSVVDAKREIALWFTPSELVSYTTAHHMHIF